MEYDDDNKEYRERHFVEQIERNKKELGENTIITVAGALLVGIGALGVIIFGDNYLESAANIKLSVLCYGEICSCSGAAIITGIMGIIKYGKNVLSNLKNINSYKDCINEIENVERKL